MDNGESRTRAPLLGEVLPVELMNTTWADRAGVHDALATPAETLAWIRAIQHRLTPQPEALTGWLHDYRRAGAAQAFQQLRVLRDALRCLAASATGDIRVAAASAGPDRQAAIETLDRACATAPTWLTLHWPDGEEPHCRLHSNATPGQTVVSMLAEQAVELFSGDLRSQLRACQAPGCVLYFVKQHPRREWCSASCGNRARVARHYHRRRNDVRASP